MNLQDYAPDFEKVLAHVKSDLNSLRSNRATPAVLENIQANVYGAKMPLIQIASIQAPEPKMLTVEPWDKNLVKDVERAIQTAGLGFSLANEGAFIRVTVPPMTEETRQELVKVLGHKLEAGRQAMRGVRDKVKENILQAEKDKAVSEDDKFRLLEDLDELTRQYNDKIKDLGEKKEAEIKL